MKKLLAPLGLVAACAACCAIPLALPAVGTLLAAGAGLAVGWECAAFVGLIVVGFGIYRWRLSRQRALNASTQAQGQGCNTTSGTTCGCAKVDNGNGTCA